MKMQNFIVIGTAKSGTTSLYHYLKQHPQIYMSPLQEPKFFAFEEGEKPNFNGPGDTNANSHVITNLEIYLKLFAERKDEVAIGEISPSYLYCQNVPERIKKILPDVKLIAILRNPVDRAYSNYLHLLASGRETLTSFEKALQVEEERICSNWEYFWHYKSQGFYYKQLKRYFNLFDKKQIEVYLYEDYQFNPLSVLQNIFSFLNVNSSFLPNISEKHNATKVPKSIAIHKFITQPNLVKSLFRPLFPSPLRQKIGGIMHK
jgi:hypothetical protein